MVEVSEATPDRASGICRACAAGWRDAYDDVLPDAYVEANVETFYRPERVAREIRTADPGERWLVAVDDGTVVGAGRDRRPEPDVGEVFVLYVHPDRQGEGVGSALLDALSDRQRGAGATEQRVDVFADHDAALGFYAARGFEERESFPAAAVGGVDPGRRTVRLARPL